MTRTTISLTVAFALLLAGASACPLSAQTARSSKSEERPPETLLRVIHHQLLLLPFYSVFDSIDFSINGETVTLAGSVLRPTLKAHAEAAVKSIEGVNKVVNNIEVLPQSPSDDELRRAIYRAIFEDPQLARYAVQAVPPIHIIVKNGAVTLLGTVDKESDIPLAATEANKVPSVANLRNLLTLRKNDIPGK
jgi:hyperosmotically inducible protein